MRKRTIPGISWVFLAFILAAGGCKTESGGTDNNNGSLGKDKKLELSTQLKTNAATDTSVSGETYDGEVTDANGLPFKDGKIAKGKLTGWISADLTSEDNCGSLTETEAVALVSYLGLGFFKNVTISAEDVKFAELKLKVSNTGTKVLRNEKISTKHQTGTWVWVSKNVTIKGAKQEQTYGVPVSPSKDLELKLTQGWNCIYKELQLSPTAGTYFVSIKKYDHWYVL